MGVYEGFQRLRRAGTAVFVSPWSHDASVIAHHEYSATSYEYEMTIDEKLSLEQRVKTMIHEFLHFSAQFREYLGKRLTKNHPVEREIDNLTDIVYDTSPILRNYLKKLLQQESFVL